MVSAESGERGRGAGRRKGKSRRGAGSAESLAGTARSGASGARVGLTCAVEARGNGVQEGVLRRQESPHGRHLRRPWPPAPSLRGVGTQGQGRAPSSAAPRWAPRPLAQPSGDNAHPGLVGPAGQLLARGCPCRRGSEHGARPLALWPPTNAGLQAQRLLPSQHRPRSRHLPLATATTVAPVSAAVRLPHRLGWVPSPRSSLRLSGRSGSLPPSLGRPPPAPG